MKYRQFACACFLFVFVLFTGCSGMSDYQVGLYSTSVDGVITGISDVKTDEVFILVLNYHRTLLETSEGFLNRVTASLVYPNERGEYSALFDTDTTTLDLRIYAKGKLLESAKYHRSLGIGVYEYDVSLQKDENWKNTFYLMVKPHLVEFITEERYMMSQMDKLFIGDWLSKVEDEL